MRLQFIIFVLFIEVSYSQNQWNTVNSGLENVAFSLFHDSSSQKLIIGGDYPLFQGDTVNNVVAWNNDEYSTIGQGIFRTWPFDFEIYKDTLYAVGISDLSTSFLNFAKFDHTDSLWKSIPKWKGTGLYVMDLVEYKGDLIIVGKYLVIGNLKYSIVSFNGDTFTEILPSYRENLSDMWGGVVYENNFYLYGRFDTLDLKAIRNIAMWDGAIWKVAAKNSISSGRVNSMIVFNNSLYSGNSLGELYKLDTNMWIKVAQGNGSITTMEVINDKLYIGGAFDQFGSKKVNYIVEYDGIDFYSLGSGTNGSVIDIEYYNNYVYACGNFTQADGKTVNYIARWGEPVGIITISEKYKAIEIAPNPAKDYLSLKFNFEEYKSLSIRIQNLKGQIIETFEINSIEEYRINVSSYTPGNYIINIISNKTGEIHVSSFVKY